MQIKILTTYNVYNYGASLQAYALMTYLTQKGHDVELINYQPEYLTRKYDYKWVNPESKLSKYTVSRCAYRIMKYIQRQTTMSRKRKFDEFRETMLKVTRQRYNTYKELEYCPPRADLYIVGSDQIWNVFYETGRDPAFYLEFVKQGKKASYAASFSFLDISEEQKYRIAQSLQKFDAVSVREYHGLSILKELKIKNKIWVLDPIFLLNMVEWKKKMSYIATKDSYLLVYDFERNEKLKLFAKEYARRNNLKIYSINDTYPLLYADKNFNGAGPLEFLSLIYGCNAFVSNSFHGTAFSILFHKPVFVFNRLHHKVNSRMESLMSLFELSDCILSNQTKTDMIFEKKFNFKRIEEIKERELNKSKDFIERLLT